MSDMVRRIDVVLFLATLAIVSEGCSSSAKTAAPANTTTTSSTKPISTSASVRTSTTPSTPAPGSSARTTTPGPQTSWTRPSLRPDGTIPVAAFNALLETSLAAWARSPLRASVEFLRVDDTNAFTTTVRVTTNPDARAQADVVVTADGLPDDSVHATRFAVHLTRRADETWRLTSARWSQQCQPNRGHQDFTPAPCV